LDRLSLKGTNRDGRVLHHQVEKLLDGDAKMSASFCSSPPTASPPWVVRGDDCCDKDALVYLGQKDFQPSESTACGASWDYDCNGSPDREYPSTVSCSMTDLMCDASAHDGWTGVIPTCGANGTLARCGNTRCGPISCCDVTSSTSGFKQKCK